jgi:Clp amino terminal domain, pathogenicity island component
MDEPPVALGSLVRWVDGRTRHCTELDRLDLAVKVTVHLEALRDQVLDHYVEAARASGASWSQIGEHLGVTKQAAHQGHLGRRRRRFPVRGRRRRREEDGAGRGPFERMSEAARAVVVLAHEEARSLWHNYVGTEHLLLALAAGESDPDVARLLADAGLSAGAVRRAIEQEIGRGPREPPALPMAFAPRAKRALEVAVRGAGEEQAGPRDLLYGVLSVKDGVAVTIAQRLGVDVERWLAQLDREA